jgi:sortase A
MKIRLQWRRESGSAGHRFLRWVELAFLLVGFLALGYCALVWFQAGFYQSYENWNFENHVKFAPPPVTVMPGQSQRVPHFAVADGALFGRIEIPRLGVSVMVIEGVKARSLKVAVGHVPGTALPGEPGNVAIAGHRDTFFRRLRQIRNSDAIRLTTLYGSYDYRVESTRVVGPREVGVLQSSNESELTLVTCYPFYYAGPAPDRFIVRAHLVVPANDGNARISLFH